MSNKLGWGAVPLKDRLRMFQYFVGPGQIILGGLGLYHHFSFLLNSQL
jgi:hypothetical protein